MYVSKDEWTAESAAEDDNGASAATASQDAQQPELQCYDSPSSDGGAGSASTEHSEELTQLLDMSASGMYEQQAATPMTLSVIGETLVFRGDLTAEEDLLIQGRVSGSITHRAQNLTIGASGDVQADIVAQHVIIQGRVRGDVRASESIVVAASARVQGNLYAPTIGLKEGAKFKGSIDMDPGAWELPKKPAPSPQQSSGPQSGSGRSSAAESSASQSASSSSSSSQSSGSQSSSGRAASASKRKSSTRKAAKASSQQAADDDASGDSGKELSDAKVDNLLE